MNKTCPLCGTTLIPRYSFAPIGDYKDLHLNIEYICPDCIPPEGTQ